MTRMPEFSTLPSKMPCIWGLLPAAKILAFGLVIVAISALWRLCRRTEDLGLAGAATAAFGVIVAPHALVSDCALMLPLGVLAFRNAKLPTWLTVLFVTPIPTLFLGSSLDWLGQLTLVASVIAFIVTAGVGSPLPQVSNVIAREVEVLTT
ncbi:MAG: hypothetical protein JO061_11170 [Acidobacteriaceae bacterium]|nr:hypothetical protein [Acidobacteriaceae bacterium]